MIKPPYTRREAQKLTPEILGQYHALVMDNNFDGFDRLLAQYNIPEETKQELRDDFKHYAAKALTWRWRTPK
jgi:hypothetical protein